jgi:hypothetical protein
MSNRPKLFIILVILLLAALPCHAARAAKTPVTPIQQWQGSEDDLALLQGTPEVIVEPKVLQELWQAWKVPGPVPEPDFSTELVVAQTTRGGILRLAATLDDRGNLQVGGMATRDLRPGFRYVIAVLSRAGVKSINGRDLPQP